MAKAKTKLKWTAGSLVALGALVLSLYLSLGGCWQKLDGRVYAVEKKTEVHDVQLEALKEGQQLIRQDVRASRDEIRSDMREFREVLYEAIQF